MNFQCLSSEILIKHLKRLMLQRIYERHAVALKTFDILFLFESGDKKIKSLLIINYRIPLRKTQKINEFLCECSFFQRKR